MLIFVLLSSGYWSGLMAKLLRFRLGVGAVTSVFGEDYLLLGIEIIFKGTWIYGLLGSLHFSYSVMLLVTTKINFGIWCADLWPLARGVLAWLDLREKERVHVLEGIAHNLKKWNQRQAEIMERVFFPCACQYGLCGSGFSSICIRLPSFLQG